MSIYIWYFDPGVNLPWGSKYHMTLAILYCYSNMGRHYIHEYLTPSDSEGLNLMIIRIFNPER